MPFAWAEVGRRTRRLGCQHYGAKSNASNLKQAFGVCGIWHPEAAEAAKRQRPKTQGRYRMEEEKEDEEDEDEKASLFYSCSDQI